MLYDYKRWEKTEVKAEPLTLPHLIAWLETMPANGSYNWHDCDGECLIGLYGKAHGIPWHVIVKKDQTDTSPYNRLTGETAIAYCKPHTFGAALTRARAAAAR